MSGLERVTNGQQVVTKLVESATYPSCPVSLSLALTKVQMCGSDLNVPEGRMMVAWHEGPGNPFINRSIP
jgi:hypothetical protein